MDYTSSDFEKAFLSCGLKKGDSIFLTTSLGMLGTLKLEKKKLQINIIAKILLDSLLKIIGKNGNIFVPTYSYSFRKLSKKKNYTFSTKNTKSLIGYFPNFFLKQKGRIRSIDPMVSVAGIGKKCEYVLKKISYTSYGKNCVFERLLKIKNMQCCNVGLGVNWIPFIHYLDWINKVPFRYDKFFEGLIIDGKIKKKVRWHYPVRILRKETISDGYKIGKLALKEKLFKYHKLGKSKVYVINYKKFFYFAKFLTSKNKWLTVNGPKFKS